MEKLAEAYRQRAILEAQAEAEAIRLKVLLLFFKKLSILFGRLWF